jgi:hypothetical protein
MVYVRGLRMAKEEILGLLHFNALYEIFWGEYFLRMWSKYSNLKQFDKGYHLCAVGIPSI